MISRLIFDKYANPERHKDKKSGLTFPVPFDYLQRTFRLELGDKIEDAHYEVVQAAEPVLEKALDINLRAYGYRRTVVYKPDTHRPPVPLAKADKDDPMGVRETGAVIYCQYADFWGRKGLALAVMPPRHFKTQNDDDVAFAFYGYFDGDNTFHLHQIAYPFFSYDGFKRLTGLHNNRLHSQRDVHRDFHFGQILAQRIFAGERCDPFELWDASVTRYVRWRKGPQPPAPWSDTDHLQPPPGPRPLDPWT